MRAERKSVTVASALAVVLSVSLAGCSGSASENPPAQGESGSASDAPSDGGGDSGATTPRGADLAVTSFAISWTDAVDAAMDKFDGRLTDVELDWSMDRYAYAIELVSDSEEYEVRVDADTGEQFDESTEAIESDDIAEKQAEVVDLDEVVSWEDALATALDAQSGTVNEWKLEGTSHGPQYQFDVDDDSGEDYEVSVDATTGDLLGVDD